jgi:hypothetical protein
MIWMAEAVDGTFFDEKSHWLKTDDGDLIASLYLQPDGRLEIGQGMDTNFHFQDGRVHCGWTCEEHICSGVTLENEGGVLDYQKGRCLFQQGTPITIGIAIGDGDKEGFFAIPSEPHYLPRSGSFLRRIFSFLR